MIMSFVAAGFSSRFKVRFHELVERIFGCDIERLDILRRQFKHGVHHYGLHNGAESACAKFVFYSLIYYKVQSVVCEV